MTRDKLRDIIDEAIIHSHEENKKLLDLYELFNVYAYDREQEINWLKKENEKIRIKTAQSYEARAIEVMHDYFRELESGETKFADVYELSTNAVKAITKDFN